MKGDTPHYLLHDHHLGRESSRMPQIKSQHLGPMMIDPPEDTDILRRTIVLTEISSLCGSLISPDRGRDISFPTYVGMLI